MFIYYFSNITMILICSIKNIKQKVLKIEEMEELFNEVGFIIEKVYGDFDKGAYLRSSPALIFIARKNNLIFQ